jgi:hypothetical protein
LSNAIQNLLCDPPLTMILDMGLGSREQSLPVHDSEPLRVTAGTLATPVHPSIAKSPGGDESS